MNGPVLGFDFGQRRIGIAVGSFVTGEARPLVTVLNRGGEPDWAEVDRAVEDWRPAALVVGVPYNADGSAHGVTKAAEAFAVTLGGRYQLPVHTVDERLSSYAAGDALVERRKRGDHRRVRQGEVDAAAAAVILNDWLGKQQAAGEIASDE